MSFNIAFGVSQSTVNCARPGCCNTPGAAIAVTEYCEGTLEEMALAEWKKYEWMNYSRARRGAQPVTVPRWIEEWAIRNLSREKSPANDIVEEPCTRCGALAKKKRASMAAAKRRSKHGVLCDECVRTVRGEARTLAMRKFNSRQRAAAAARRDK